MKKSLLLFPALILLVSSCGETKETERPLAVVEEVPEQSQVKDPVIMAEPKVFYYDYNEQRGTEDGIVMSKENAIAEMQNLPESDGNFFGMELSDGTIVQFMYDGPKATWFLDIPNPVTQESYNADLSPEDVEKIISDVYDGKSADDIKAAYK
jgi:hypothetical protein